jgi:hypothetical protein
MDVILSEAKDLTIGIRVCLNQLKIDEAKITKRSSGGFSVCERSVAPLGMTLI